MIFTISQNVVQRASKMGISKIEETEKIDREGNPYTEIKTVQIAPDANLGLRILEKFDEDWKDKKDEPSGDTDTGTDTRDTSDNKKDPLEEQIERANEAFQGLEEE